MSKVAHIARILASRICRGDYLVADFPSDRELAAQMKVNRLTVRKAVQRLVSEGLLKRKANGRAVCASNAGHNKLTQIAILTPAFSSSNYDWWRLEIERCAVAKEILVRPVDYLHWDDPILSATLSNFSGVFLWPLGGVIPVETEDLIRRTQTPIALLESDGEYLGLPSVHAFVSGSVELLLVHLVSRGHRRIDVLNTQNYDTSMRLRIQQCRNWCETHRIEGHFHNFPVKPYESTVKGGYDAVLEIIAEGKLLSASSLLCTSEPTAIGAMRAMYDSGIEPGRDIAVCALHDQGVSHFLIPSLTVLERPDPTTPINRILDWMQSGERRWAGPYNLNPGKLVLYEGESTQKSTTPNYVKNYE